jgi:hypothetical protein
MLEEGIVMNKFILKNHPTKYQDLVAFAFAITVLGMVVATGVELVAMEMFRLA